MKANLLIAFGKPGAGKSYIADILEKSFGYFSYNGDEALPPDMREKLFQKKDITEDMRGRFLDNMITAIKRFSVTKEKIAIHQTLLREYMLEQFRKSFPKAKFILVECNDDILKKRYMKRKYFNLGGDYLQLMIDMFEAPGVPHVVIYNNKEGPKEIIKQLQKIGV